MNDSDIWIIHFHADKQRYDHGWADRKIHLTTLETFASAFGGGTHTIHLCRYGVPPLEFNLKRAGSCSKVRLVSAHNHNWLEI